MKYDNRFIALDCETGGLLGKNKVATIDVALTEVAVCSICAEKLVVLEKEGWLIIPYDDNLIYEAKAAEISGINKQLCFDEGIDIEQVYRNLVNFFKKNKMGSKKPILIIQNKSFDIPFIENLFKIFGDDLWKYIERVEDTLEWARFKWFESSDYKLGTIAEKSGLDLTQAHRALPDTIITAKIWINFMKSLRGESKLVEQESVVEKFRNGFRF